MIAFDLTAKKLCCDRNEWGCFSHTPDNIIEEVNALVYAVVTTNNDPVIAQKIIYDTIAANETYRKCGFSDSEGDQCTTNIINKYYDTTITRWAYTTLKAYKKNEKWIHNPLDTSDSEKVQEETPMKLSNSTCTKLAEALSDDVANYIRENDRFKKLIPELIGEALQHQLGCLNSETTQTLTIELVKKMYLVGMED
jgi:hypothetical protein